MMIIKSVSYQATINLGDYSNEKIGFVAEVIEGEDINLAIETLKAKVREVGGLNADEFYSKRNEYQRVLNELEKKIHKAKEQWDSTAEFLRTQGIKPDAPNLPMFTNLLPEVSQEYSGVVDGEIENDYQDGF